MSATLTAPEMATEASESSLRRWVRRNAWTLGLFAILAILFLVTKLIQPRYGPGGVRGLAIGVLPVAFAAVAQTCAVLARGIDLSVGSMMALTSVVAAVLMEGRSEEFAILVVIGVLVLGALLGAINGALIVFTRVPDIVVTLAMLFVWAGVALVILQTPGGSSAEWLSDLTRGSFVIDLFPRAALFLIVTVAVIWIPVRRSRLGLSIYAVGSDPLAAFRSGVSVSRTRVFAYTLTGLFAALGGLTLTATTGLASPVPGPYTLTSVAAVVLGGHTGQGVRPGDWRGESGCRCQAESTERRKQAGERVGEDPGAGY